MFVILGFSLCWFLVFIIDFVDMFIGGGNLLCGVFMFNGFLIFMLSFINFFIYWLINCDF